MSTLSLVVNVKDNRGRLLVSSAYKITDSNRVPDRGEQYELTPNLALPIDHVVRAPNSDVVAIGFLVNDVSALIPLPRYGWQLHLDKVF